MSVVNVQKMFFGGTIVAGRQEMTVLFQAKVNNDLNWDDGNDSIKK